MPISQTLAAFNACVTQCDSLIASAHRTDANGDNFFPKLDREQITVAAFLNLFIGWEEFIESSISDFLMGDITRTGKAPIRYLRPVDREHSIRLVVHTHRFFDYSNHESVRRLTDLYLKDGYPFKIPISSITADLNDLKTIRNSCAHMSSTTTRALESLSIRILGQSQPGINVYRLLVSIDPRVQGGTTTVYDNFRDKLKTAAFLITQG